MHAFIFWHRPAPGVATAEYEDRLVAFHRALADHAPSGFIASATCRIDPVPWLGGKPGYEDWYLVEGSWALDPLNDRAVTGVPEPAHAAVASQAGPGAGGLYRLTGGTPTRTERSVATWLTRPRGIQHQPILEGLRGGAGEGATTWRRQMVLGPAPELAVIARAAIDARLPPGWQARAVARTALWHGPRWGASAG